METETELDVGMGMETEIRMIMETNMEMGMEIEMESKNDMERACEMQPTKRQFGKPTTHTRADSPTNNQGSPTHPGSPTHAFGVRTLPVLFNHYQEPLFTAFIIG